MLHSNEDSDQKHKELAAASAALKAMGNEHRLLALLALAQRPLAVCELNRQLPLAQSALSQHLARLRAAGLVVCQRDGSRVLYALADGRVRRLVEAVSSEYRIARRTGTKCPAGDPAHREPPAGDLSRTSDADAPAQTSA